MAWTSKYPYQDSEYNQDGTVSRDVNHYLFISAGEGDNKTAPETKTWKLKINDILITVDVIQAQPKHEQSLRIFPYHSTSNTNSSDYNKLYNESSGFKYTVGVKVSKAMQKDQNTVMYGHIYSYDACADITGWDSIKVRATEGMILYANIKGSNDREKTVLEDRGADGSNGGYHLYSAPCPNPDNTGHVWLRSIYTAGDCPEGRIQRMTVCKRNDAIDYYISGKVFKDNKQNQSVTNALNDNGSVNDDGSIKELPVRNIDATELRNTNPIDLTPVNRNCLVYVKDESKVSACHFTYDVPQGWVKDKNNLVVVSGGGTSPLSYKIEDLYLKDAVASYMHFKDAGVSKLISEFHYPFYAPFDITTVSKAYYEMYVPEGKWGTLCLPFYVDKAQMSTDIELYELKGTMYNNGHYYANVSKVDHIESNIPYIVKGVSGGNYHKITSNRNSMVEKTELNKEDYLTGVYSKTTATPGTYVLQDLNDGLAFYRVAAGEEPTMYQFRAYFTKSDGDTGKAKAFVIRFEDGTTTTIKPNDWAGPEPVVVQTYDVSGVRRQGLRKGLNIVKMSDGSVRKVIK